MSKVEILLCLSSTLQQFYLCNVWENATSDSGYNDWKEQPYGTCVCCKGCEGCKSSNIGSILMDHCTNFLK